MKEKISFQYSSDPMMRLFSIRIFIILLVLFTCNNLMAQTIPRVAVCPDSPLQPISGKSYTYSVSVAAPYTTPQSFDWFVTDQPSFINGSTIVTAGIIPNTKDIIDAGSGYHDPATGTNSLTIKWSGKAVVNAATKPYFLVISYKGTNGTLCEAMNVKAYRIEPKSAFTLDITNQLGATDLGLNGSNLATLAKLCVSDILSASYDGSKMVYDYGINYLIFKVTAANFSGGWKPTLKISGLQAGQTIDQVEWALTTTFAGVNLFSVAADIWSTANKVPAPADNITEDGESIYIRVTIKNNNFEGITDTSVLLAVNGITDDNFEDIHYTDCLADGYTNDVATQIILARPTMTSATGTPVLSFIP